MTGKIHFVSAGAGSGKTYKLTELLYGQLSTGKARPSGVLATTFTRKAAAELRERVRSGLLAREDWAGANAMGQARIGTVNSVCGSLLERFAFEAGLAPQQQVLEEGQAALLLKRAVDVVLEAAPLQELLAIVRRLGLADDWSKHLRSLVDHARANDIGADDLRTQGPKNATDLLGQFPATTTDNLDAAARATIGGLLPGIEQAAGVKGVQRTADFIAAVKEFALRLGAGRDPWANWVRVGKAEPEVALRAATQPIRDVVGRFPEHPRLHADLRRYVELMFATAADALAVYAENKRQLGVLDFVDQEHLLLGVLDHPEVCAVLRDELDLLLVDEFQDTSPIQLALFVKLASLAKETYWVGDVKQAIYGFRGSDSKLMQAVLDALPGLGGDVTILGDSWRSRPVLVQLINEVFVGAFAGKLAPAQITLAAQREEIDTGPAFANWIVGGKNKVEEAAALALGVRRLVDESYQVFDPQTKTIRNLRYADIAVLVRINDNVTEVATAFGKAGVPTATEQPGLLGRPEIILALACLRRLVDPEDTVATAEILSLADCTEPETWLADRLRHLEQGRAWGTWKEAGEGSHPVLQRIAGLRCRLPLLSPREAVQLVMTEADLARTALQWTPGEAAARTRLANLDALLALAAQYEDGQRNQRAPATVAGWLLWLTALAKDKADGVAEPAVDAVRVLTHHAAKGLEWPVVILRDLHDKVRDNLWGVSARSMTAVDVANPLAERYVRYWPWPFGLQEKFAFATDLANSTAGRAFADEATDEAKRLLYVSTTRARDLLVLARSSRKPTGPWLESLDAGWLCPSGPDEPLSLPSGATIAHAHWTLDPPTDDVTSFASSERAAVRYFFPAEAGEPLLPLAFRPSDAGPALGTVAEVERIGRRVPLTGAVDVTAVGTAVHACLALALADSSRPLQIDEVRALLEGHGVHDGVDADEVREQVGQLLAWIGQRWPGCRPVAELPVESIRANGQVLRGRIDLLLDTPNGWVVLDHKTFPGPSSEWQSVAMEHGGQLQAYATAVAKATGRSVAEVWITFPIGGGAVRLSV